MKILSPILYTIAAFVLAGAVALTTGCASMNWTADRIGKGVSAYCDRTSTLEREAIRARVNLRADPHDIRVECRDD